MGCTNHCKPRTLMIKQSELYPLIHVYMRTYLYYCISICLNDVNNPKWPQLLSFSEHQVCYSIQLDFPFNEIVLNHSWRGSGLFSVFLVYSILQISRERKDWNLREFMWVGPFLSKLQHFTDLKQNTCLGCFPSTKHDLCRGPVVRLLLFAQMS